MGYGKPSNASDGNLRKLCRSLDDLSGAFELLARAPGVTVSRNGASFLRIDANEESISAVNALLVANGIKVYELSPAQESLEQAFLRLTETVAAGPASSAAQECVTSFT